MDQLPVHNSLINKQVSLISTDLKYTLSSLKIKTLQKAREYFITQQLAIDQGVLDLGVGVIDKLQKIKKYLGKYDKIRDQVEGKINFVQQQQQLENECIIQQGSNVIIREVYSSIHAQSMLIVNKDNDNQALLLLANEQSLTQSINNNINNTNNNDNEVIQQQQQQQRLFYQNQSHHQTIYKSQLKRMISHCLSVPGITQITGQKGSGKTVLALYFCQLFSQISPKKKLYLINCSGGISYSRFQRLQTTCPNIQYRDSYQLQHVLKVCESAVKDELTGCVVVDGLTNLLMQQQKTLVFLLKLFKLFTTLLSNKRQQCRIVLTNYVQQIFENNENDQLTNHYTYYSSVTSEFIRYKMYLKREKKDKVQVRLVRGGFGSGEFVIGKDGVVGLE